MAPRLFNGHRFSENGWPYVDEGGCTWTTVPGCAPPVTLQIQNGPPLLLLRSWAADWNAWIEPLRDRDSACWTPGNSVETSNHPGGTAEDLNWDSHPFQKRGSLNADQMAAMAEMEAFYEGNVFWAGRWRSPIDEMHSQVGYDTYDQDADQPTAKVLDFCARKIRADGYSTFRRGAAPDDHSNAALILAHATGLTLERAMVILPTMSAGLAAADCTNPRRIAMFIAQTGEESAGYDATEEYASGDEYDTRTDLGNTPQVDGDGRLFKGRTWIQITGHDHYAEFSDWAHDKGMVPTTTYFLDHPTELADMKWAGIGAAWYWTVARPRINAMCDAGDLLGVTRAINGGTHGLQDRSIRYSRASAVGDDLLRLLNATPTVTDPWEEALMSAPFASASHYRADNIANLSPVEAIRQINAMDHERMVEDAALRGELWAIQCLGGLAAGVLPGAQDLDGAFWRNRAVGLLNAIAAAHPEWLTAANPATGKAA